MKIMGKKQVKNIIKLHKNELFKRINNSNGFGTTQFKVRYPLSDLTRDVHGVSKRMNFSTRVNNSKTDFITQKNVKEERLVHKIKK